MTDLIAEDFRHLAALIRDGAWMNRDSMWCGALLSNNVNLILAALDLATESYPEKEQAAD